jgi:glycosyltransferase involved in cell wall biosynthesis
VVFSGPVSRKDIIHHLDAVDIGVLPHSNQFGSPLILFEMMALGKPIVAPSLPPIDDVIDHELNGLLFDPLNTDMLLKRIRTLLDDTSLSRRLGDRAREICFSRYTWEANARIVLQSLQNA